MLGLFANILAWGTSAGCELVDKINDKLHLNIPSACDANIHISFESILNAVAPGLASWTNHPESRIAVIFFTVILPIGILFGLGALIAAGYKLMTSQGQPDRVKAGSEQLTSAITGTVFIVLSLAILRFIMKTLF